MLSVAIWPIILSAIMLSVMAPFGGVAVWRTGSRPTKNSTSRSFPKKRKTFVIVDVVEVDQGPLL